MQGINFNGLILVLPFLTDFGSFDPGWNPLFMCFHMEHKGTKLVVDFISAVFEYLSYTQFHQGLGVPIPAGL